MDATVSQGAPLTLESNKVRVAISTKFDDENRAMNDHDSWRGRVNEVVFNRRRVRFLPVAVPFCQCLDAFHMPRFIGIYTSSSNVEPG